MNNFEERMLCDYLLKVKDKISFCSEEFRNFYLDLKKQLNLSESEFPIYLIKTVSDYSKFEKAFTRSVKKNLKNLKIKNTKLEKKINKISKIYNLTNIEQNIFTYYTLMNQNNKIKKLHTILTISDTPFYAICVNILQIKFCDAENARKSLLDKGLFVKYSMCDSKVEMSTTLRSIMENSSINTETQIKEILLGKKLKSSLKWSNFEFLGNKKELASKLLFATCKNKKSGVNILLYGAVGTGKTEFAKLLANKSKVEMYSVITKLGKKEALREDRLQDLFSKQTLLELSENSCILFDEAEDVMNRGFSDFGKASKGYLNQIIEKTPVPIIWTTNNILDVDAAFLRRMTYTIEFEKLSEETRLTLWEKAVRKNKLKIDKQKLSELNKNYEIPPSLIVSSVESTKLINGTQDDIEAFAESVARVVMKKKNVKKQKSFEMNEYNENLVNTDLDIKTLTSRIKASGKLNFSLCLYGEPGTGKSLYARYLANKLGIEVILKRASDLISKYVGETEQNIANAFAEAKNKGAMLIFDEADSFLQNRQNANRSWEIAQVNEMLTWMESHEYPFVCTTNLLATLDEASLRRFTFKIKFDFLTPEQVNYGINHFFGLQEVDSNLKGLTAGDFATVKKKAEFLGISDVDEIISMLKEEVKIKKSKELQNTVGF